MDKKQEEKESDIESIQIVLGQHVNRFIWVYESIYKMQLMQEIHSIVILCLSVIFVVLLLVCHL